MLEGPAHQGLFFYASSAKELEWSLHESLSGSKPSQSIGMQQSNLSGKFYSQTV